MSNNEFRYSYCAGDRAELKRIREKYTAETENFEISSMDRIRLLDSGVTKKGTRFALVCGIIGALVMGAGMSLIMTDLKEILGLNSSMALLIGIIIGFIGMVGVVAAYPVYQKIIAKERRKVAPEILRLTDEILKDGK